MNPDRDERDVGGSGGLAVLVVAGILVVMLVLVGGGALWYVMRLQTVQVQEVGDVMVAEAAAKVEAADAANEAPELGAGREAVAEKESGKGDAGAGEDGKGEKTETGGTRNQ